MNFKRKIHVMALSILVTSTLVQGTALGAPVDAKQATQATGTMYTVKKGDTLYKIGKQYGVRYQDIQTWNNLSTTLIRVGQTLYISKPSTSTNQQPVTYSQSTTTTSQRQNLINAANKMIGAPYKWAGTTPSGFDCSGFMYYTLKSQGLVNSRLNVSGYWAKATKVKTPQPGDLVFFQNTYKAGPSHMGIFLGNGQFIHAGANGVAVDSVNSTYWKQHFLGYGTFY